MSASLPLRFPAAFRVERYPIERNTPGRVRRSTTAKCRENRLGITCTVHLVKEPRGSGNDNTASNETERVSGKICKDNAEKS